MLVVGHSLGHQSSALLELGCAVKMVHAASLFLDDMPCMGNVRLRRSRLAMLGAVALVSQAFALLPLPRSRYLTRQTKSRICLFEQGF